MFDILCGIAFVYGMGAFLTLIIAMNNEEELHRVLAYTALWPLWLIRTIYRGAQSIWKDSK